MRKTLSEKAIRRIVASLVASEFSSTEIREIALAFRDERFTYELQNAILEINFILSRSIYDSPNLHSDLEVELDEALDLMKRKRVSKDAFIRMAQAIAPNVELPRNSTTKQMLEHMAYINSEYISSVLVWLRNGEEDPFLKGIMARKK